MNTGFGLTLLRLPYDVQRCFYRLGSTLLVILPWHAIIADATFAAEVSHALVPSVPPRAALVSEAPVPTTGPSNYVAIDLSEFRDSIQHWQRKDGRGRRDHRFAKHQIIQIADNLLTFQNPDGGWPTNLDWLAQIDADEIRTLRGGTLGNSSFDNRNTYPQIEYLSQVYLQTKVERYRQAAERGWDFILGEQRASGGWRGKDVDAITFNDDVMVGIMGRLLEVRSGAPQYAWLDADRRVRLEQALDRAIDVTLKCQIVVDGKRTAWCQQHDHDTLLPIAARAYELPSITAQESAAIVQFLMQLPPTAAIDTAIESALSWFRSAEIHGLRIVEVPIAPVRFEHFTATVDRIATRDDTAPPIWARFYEIDTNRPFFCNRDGKKVYRLSDVLLERRVGYAWYGYWPAKLLAIRPLTGTTEP